MYVTYWHLHHICGIHLLIYMWSVFIFLDILLSILSDYMIVIWNRQIWIYNMEIIIFLKLGFFSPKERFLNIFLKIPLLPCPRDNHCFSFTNHSLNLPIHEFYMNIFRNMHKYVLYQVSYVLHNVFEPSSNISVYISSLFFFIFE